MSVIHKLRQHLRPEKRLAKISEIDLTWVDEFIAHVRPYIFVRTEDNLLIKRPNQAQKLNAAGAKMLKTLLDGQSIHSLLEDVGPHPQKTVDIANFLYAVRQQLDGGLDRFSENPAVDVQPFDMAFSDYPVLSEIAITYCCNLKCAFCYAGSGCTQNPTGSDEEMRAEEVKKVLWKIFHQAQVPSVSFTGGEPTLVPELPELIRYAKNLGMRVNLITNGTMITQEMAENLADHGLDSAQVSLEGVSAATHDSLVGFPGAYSKTLAAVKHLKTAGIITHTNTTISRANQDECVQFPQFVKDRLNCDTFSMNLIIPAGSGAVHDDLIVPYSEIGGLLKRILDASKEQNVEFMWYSPVPMCMFNTIVYGLGNKGCSACDGLLSVGANGDVLPCASYDDSVGNLLHEDFWDIWQSRTAIRYRQKKLAHEICQECEHFAVCNGACPLYWRQVGFDELFTTVLV
ncbi:radical SAM/SPASM domain-containing protein [candidate division KSB3 bacterium]|uniref:Radical SAM/SPASM domain-containing protein n=1 Tax=candidate division KSB3 bacterium TaxID=2044937 RepID=A0A2G6KE20_9BACT|nr:MAG: radical SAM/SPASM domain-containing protein [candidate division KSB3 bacterium]